MKTLLALLGLVLSLSSASAYSITRLTFDQDNWIYEMAIQTDAPATIYINDSFLGNNLTWHYNHSGLVFPSPRYVIGENFVFATFADGSSDTRSFTITAPTGERYGVPDNGTTVALLALGMLAVLVSQHTFQRRISTAMR
jgi:hypothetical protein